MGQVLTREEWNNLVTSINDLASSPRSGCVPAPTLDLVPEGHKWSVADIQAARDTLTAICNENVFSAPLHKWKSEIVQELRDAYFRGWCGCEPTPCNDPVTYSIGPFPATPYPWTDWIGVLAGEICYSSERWVQDGWIHGVYPALEGFQVYADFYVSEWDASTPQNVRTWYLVKHYDDYMDEGLCPGHPVHLGERGIHGGELQPDGSIQLWSGGQDPDVPGGYYAITNAQWQWVSLPFGYQLRGNCFSIGLDNFTVAHGLPGNTLVGHIVCSDPHYNVNLVPHPNLYQVGNEIRTLRTFSEWEYLYELIFTLRATGNGTCIYGPFDRSFKLRIT